MLFVYASFTNSGTVTRIFNLESSDILYIMILIKLMFTYIGTEAI